MNLIKTIAAIATLAIGSTVTAHDINTPDAIIPFAEEPAEATADADMSFVNLPGHTDANGTYALIGADKEPINRDLQVVEGVLAGLQIAAAVAPMIADIIKGSKKECQQVACWIGTASRPCALSVAEKVQSDMMMGRDRYRTESIQPNGMWVRYWRTKFEPIDRADIATGKCSNGATFAVTNCQSTGRVHC